MLGEILGEIGSQIAISMVVGAVDTGVTWAHDKYNDFQKLKYIKSLLDVDDDVYLQDAVEYYDLLDNIDSLNFESRKKSIFNR